MLNIGNKEVKEIFLGNKKVSEVYLGEKKIRPIVSEWRPTANTLAYYPFKENNADQTGRTSLLPSSQQKWELWYRFSQKTIYTPKVSAKFASYRIKPWVVNASQFLSVWAIEEWYTSFLMGHPDVNGYANSVQTFDGTNWYNVKLNLEANKWYHLAYGNDGEKTVVYVNGEQKIIRTWPPAPFIWYESILTSTTSELYDFILESKARTPEEVKAYYDSTKAIFERANNYTFTPTADTIYYNKFKGENWNGRYVDTGVAFESGSFTVSLWAKAAREFSYGNGWFWTLIGKYRWWAGGSQEAFILGVSCRGHDSQLAGLWLRDLNRLESDDDIEHTRMNPGEWHQIVATYDANTKVLSFATDGVVRITKNKNFWAYGNHSFYVGAMHDVNWITGYFDWNIEEVILEKKAWSAEKIADYYNSTKWQFWL